MPDGEAVKPVTIAIDAMSGDRGAAVVVSAALDAVKENEALSLVLVGIRSELEALLHDGHPRIRIVEAADVVRMNERPSHALRHKRNSSMAVALGLVRDGAAQGCVSAGNTGALMAFGRSVIRMYPGIERPAIAKLIPSLRGRCHVLDLGANVDSPAQRLVEFALMGAVMAQCVDGVARPRVGLLNVGVEATKGGQVVREADILIRSINEASLFDYQGYAEGGDLFQGYLDVLVCDGFVGNAVLKSSEGLARMLVERVQATFESCLTGRLVGFLARPALKRLKQELDPVRYNGASLLGLSRTVIKSHGASHADGFCYAVVRAIDEVAQQLPERLAHRLMQLPRRSE